MNQDEMKQAVARAALDYVEVGTVIGIGTGSTANYFIDELAKIKGKIDGTVASSLASAERLKGHGIPVLELNDVAELSVYVDGADETTRLPLAESVQQRPWVERHSTHAADPVQSAATAS